VADDTMQQHLRRKLKELRRVYHNNFQNTAPGEASQIFSRSLAFVALAYAEMAEATNDLDYVSALHETCDVIARFERQNIAVDGTPQSAFVMSSTQDSLPYADCHFACLFALAKATAVLKENRWLPAVDRGLAALRIDTMRIDFEGPKKQDVVGVDYVDRKGQRHTMEMYWSFKSALCLRFLNFIKSSSHEGLRLIWAKHEERVSILEMLIHLRLRKSLRYHQDGIEILTSVLSSETNSETQPWAALGLCGDR
jgi:hypothetical protein